MFRGFIASIAVLALCNGCVALTVTVKECPTTGCEARGQMDGRAGLPASTVQDYQSSCSRQLVAVDVKAYEQGRLQGIAHFCTTERGFSYALKGGDYLQSCPATMQEDFLAGYNAGLRMYSVSQPLKEARSGADIATYAARADLSTLVAASDPVYAGLRGHAASSPKEAAAPYKKQIRQLEPKCEQIKVDLISQGFNPPLDICNRI